VGGNEPVSWPARLPMIEGYSAVVGQAVVWPTIAAGWSPGVPSPAGAPLRVTARWRLRVSTGERAAFARHLAEAAETWAPLALRLPDAPDAIVTRLARAVSAPTWRPIDRDRDEVALTLEVAR
jgi:hypothetical protein